MPPAADSSHTSHISTSQAPNPHPSPTPKSPLSHTRTPLLTTSDARAKIEALEDAHYVQNPTDTQLMPIKRFGGVGVIYGWRVPSIMVYLLKGRTYKVGKAKGAVGRGTNSYDRPG
jgi:hypothetical protein